MKKFGRIRITSGNSRRRQQWTNERGLGAREACNKSRSSIVIQDMKLQPHCAFGPGEVVPVIDRERCENKGPCVSACPYDVLIIRKLTQAKKSTLSFPGRVKLWVH